MKSRNFLSEMQKKALIHFMELEPNLCKSKFTSEFTYQVAKEKWLKIASRLNCIPGAYKDWVQWRRTWQDLKKQVKKKKLLPEVILAEDEEKLLRLIEDCVDDNGESRTSTEQSNLEAKEEVLYVEYPDSHTNAGDPQSAAEWLKEFDKEHMEIEHYIDSNENADQPARPKQTFKRKRPMSIPEKEFRLRETYFREKLMVMRRYYQERIKVERDNAKSRQRIACALEKFVTKYSPSDR